MLAVGEQKQGISDQPRHSRLPPGGLQDDRLLSANQENQQLKPSNQEAQQAAQQLREFERQIQDLQKDAHFHKTEHQRADVVSGKLENDS